MIWTGFYLVTPLILPTLLLVHARVLQPKSIVLREAYMYVCPPKDNCLTTGCLYQNYDDCTKFWECRLDKVPREKQCPEGTEFNERVRVCDFPPSPTCENRPLPRVRIETFGFFGCRKLLSNVLGVGGIVGNKVTIIELGECLDISPFLSFTGFADVLCPKGQNLELVAYNAPKCGQGTSFTQRNLPPYGKKATECKNIAPHLSLMPGKPLPEIMGHSAQIFCV